MVVEGKLQRKATTLNGFMVREELKEKCCLPSVSTDDQHSSANLVDELFIKMNHTIISSASCELCLALCAAAALVHAFVTSRLDHCSSILAGLPLAQTAGLDRVLRCAARLIGRIPKYGSVSAYMRDTVHWLPMAYVLLSRVNYPPS